MKNNKKTKNLTEKEKKNIDFVVDKMIKEYRETFELLKD